jgi:hypothetical protein
MGRYYAGDINGKFWFALQSSEAPSRFGGTEYQPEYIEYHFNEEDHLEEVENEIKSIEKSLGSKYDVIEKFFEDNSSYNDEMIKPFFTKEELSNYADLLLGREIRDCIKTQGICDFTAEL